MSTHTYLKPPWMQRQIANRLVPIFQPDMVSKLSVRGRRTGQWHTVPVAVMEHEGHRYLVSYRGESDWARNLRASLSARLHTKAGDEDIEVEEVPVSERGPLMEAYHERYARMPTVSGVLRALPDPADHPIFVIIRTQRTVSA
jgi:deazaflavin-dependent oxidoreductase (nitroreductase family)